MITNDPKGFRINPVDDELAPQYQVVGISDNPARVPPCVIDQGPFSKRVRLTGARDDSTRVPKIQLLGDFQLNLADLGSGAVDTTVSRGTGSATFTRATEATCRLSSGLLKKVATGVARSHYLSSGVYAGYLAEGARTNICLRSEEFDNASWSKTDTTITADNTAAPDGTITADLLTEGTAGTALVQQNATGTADANYAVSRFIKRGNTDWVVIQIGNGANQARAWFNLNTGAVGSTANAGTGAVVSSSIEAWANGFYRCVLVASVGSGATTIGFLTHSASADNSTTRVNNATRYEWGAQFENNVSFASSYIPTTTASATRNADVLTYAFAGNILEAAGTAYAELSAVGWTTATAANWHVAIGAAAGNLGIMAVAAGAASTTISSSDGTSTVSKSGLTDLSTGVRKRAVSWGGSARSITGDGAAVATGSYDGSFGSTALAIGLDSAGRDLFGTLKNVRIWQTQLADSVMASLTA